jgi:hypothetical protein
LFRSLRMAIAAVGVIAALIPLTGRADGMALHVSPGTLHARVEISFTFSINCPTPALGDYVAQESWAVSVEEAAGTQIASGQYENFDQYPSPMAWQCTSATVTLPVDVLATVPGPPFHKGQAILSASASVTYASGASVSASVGPRVVTLRW